MAAWPESPSVEVIDLRNLRSGALDELLNEEAAFWRDELSWEFTASAGLVKRFVDSQSLTGAALLVNGTVAGYTYTVLEDDKGMIGDLFVRREYASQVMEDRLLQTTVDVLMRTAGVHRIETQIVLFQYPRKAPPPYPEHLRMFERCFMVLDLTGEPRWGSAQSPSLDLEAWRDRFHDSAAGLITAAYDGHIDSQINDQYRSLAGARKFITNISQYPGCGAFQPQCSWLGWSPRTGRLAAMSLASQVAHDAGHITQLCVAPKERGQGLGRKILCHSLEALRAAGYRQVSLTVTSANRTAIRLYESIGFVTQRRFAAMVWDGFRVNRRFF